MAVLLATTLAVGVAALGCAPNSSARTVLFTLTGARFTVTIGLGLALGCFTADFAIRFDMDGAAIPALHSSIRADQRSGSRRVDATWRV